MTSIDHQFLSASGESVSALKIHDINILLEGYFKGVNKTEVKKN
jgi:hypothetical protein